MTGIYTAIGSAALTAAGSGVNAYSQNQNMRKEDSQTAAAITQQGAINSKAEQAVGNLNNSIAKADPNTATKQQTAAYLAAANQAGKTNTTPTVAGASKRYAQASMGAQSDIANYGRSTAANTAAVAAPSLQRIGEGNQIADTASQLGRYNDQSAAEQGILKTQLAGDQANPWLQATSALLNGAGQGLSTYAGYKKGQGMGGSSFGGYNVTPLGAGSQSLDAYGS